MINKYINQSNQYVYLYLKKQTNKITAKNYKIITVNIYAVILFFSLLSFLYGCKILLF